MSIDQRTEIEDFDLDVGKDLARSFPSEFTLQHELETTSNRYVVHLSQFQNAQLVVAGLTECSVILFDLETGKSLGDHSFNGKKQKSSVCGVVCSPVNDNDLYICSSTGEVYLFDVRTNSQVNKFSDPQNPLKPFSAFDVNCNGQLISVGTEQVKSDVFLLFFDVRQSSKVVGGAEGGYWESHENDISQVKFHPTNPNSLMTGGLDGLINLFDISEFDEDEALLGTFNTDRSVAILNWHKNSLISCLTDSNEAIFYNVDELEQVSEFSRADVTERMRRNCEVESHLINCHNTGPSGEQISLLSTSNFNNGECLRTLSYNSAKSKLQGHGNFIGNRQIVRCSYYNEKQNYFITGGEGGIISLWSPSKDSNPTQETQTESTGKAKKAHKKDRSKPY